MHILVPDPATTLASLSVPGRYTLVLVSPPFGQCDPCDELWAQLSATKDLRFEVVKVQIDDTSPRPKILSEVRRLIHASMEIAAGSDILYPIGVMQDPNGVVVQATFGKPRIDNKIREVSAALARNGPSVSAAPTQAPAAPVTPSAVTPPPARTTTDPKVAAVAIGAGTAGGGLAMLAVFGSALIQTTRAVGAPCPPESDCKSVERAAVAKSAYLQSLTTAGLILTGAGVLTTAGAALLIHEKVTSSGSLGVAASAGPTGVSVAVEGTF